MGNERWALMHELRGAAEPPLEDLIGRLQACDLVLIEGFKSGDFPKLEVWRAAVGRPPLWPDWPGIVAIATDDAPALTAAAPTVGLHDTPAIAALVLQHARAVR
jgi:molybdopterin-guanine dinucleotide biosynthesis protein B